MATVLTSTRAWSGAVSVALVLAATTGFRLHEFVPGASLLQPVLLFSVVGFAIVLQRSGGGALAARLRERIPRLVLAYFGVIALTIPFALWAGAAFEVFWAFLPTLLLVLVFQLCPADRNAVDRIELGIVVMALCLTVMLQTFGRISQGRLLIGGGSFDANDNASILALSLPLAIALFMRSRQPRRRALALLAVLALAWTIIGTGSRGGTLAMLAGALVLVAGTAGPRKVALTFALVIGGVIGWIMAPPAFRDRMVSLTNLEQDYNYTADTGRKAVWARARQYIAERPILGVGAGNFIIREGLYNNDVGRTGKWSAAHNAYLQAFSELGVIGGGIFIAILVTAGRLAFRLWRPGLGRAPPGAAWHRPELLASLAAYTVGAYFLSHAYFKPMFMLVALIALAWRAASSAEAETGFAPPPQFVGERGGLAFQPSVRDAGVVHRQALRHPARRLPAQ